MKQRFRPVELIFIGSVIAACHLAVATAGPEAPRFVALSAQTPSVNVSPRQPGRLFLDLPALEYSFDIETRCNGDWTPASLSLSVADSRVAFGATQLADNEHRNFVLRIPARQLAPVAIRDFCQLEPDTARPGRAAEGVVALGDSPVTVSAVASAHASLLCRNDNEQSITYVSQPLDVTLICESPAPSEVADWFPQGSTSPRPR